MWLLKSPAESAVSVRRRLLKWLPFIGKVWDLGGPGPSDSLIGLVVKASASRAEDPGFKSRLRQDFFGVESYQ